MSLDLSGKKVLVVDDFPEMRSMMRKMAVAFRASEVDDAKNGEEAIKQLEKNRYDIVLCDYNLGPGKDGQNVLEEAKHRSLISYGTIFMLITAENTVKMVMGAMEYYPDGYLTKPFNKAEFSARLEKVQQRKANFKDIEKAISRNDFQAAIEACDQKLAENPPNTLDILKTKGDILEKMSKYEDAEALYKSIIDKREMPWAQMGLARMRFHLKAYEDCKFILNEILQENPNYIEAYDWLAKVQEALGDLEEAQNVLQKAIEVSPKAILRHKALGQIALKNNKLDVAESSYKNAVKLGKTSCYKDPSDYTGLSKVYLNKNSPDEALKLLGEVKQEFPNDNRAEFQSSVMESMIHKQKGNDELANKALEKANSLFSSLSENVPTDAVMDLAKTCFALGKTDTAEELAKYIVRNHHEDDAVLAQTQALFNEFDMADAGQSLISNTRQEVIDINNRGVKLTKEGKLEDAIDFFEKAAVGMPENKTVNLNAAQSLIMFMQKEGKKDSLMRKTGKYLERLNKIDPADEKYQKLKSFYVKLATGK